MNNRRNHDRRRVFEAAHLVACGTGDRVDCILRDLSADGARLLVAAPRDLPADGALAVEPGRAPRPVRVVWRGDKAVGVRFTDRAPAEDSEGGTVVSFAQARAATQAPGDAERLAERVAAVTRPRARPLPVWALPA